MEDKKEGRSKHIQRGWGCAGSVNMDSFLRSVGFIRKPSQGGVMERILQGKAKDPSSGSCYSNVHVCDISQ